MTWKITCLSLVLFVSGAVPRARGEEAPEPTPPSRAGSAAILKFGQMAQAASDLNQAGQAFDRFGDSLEVLAQSLADMSRGFDPFGYKTAFETIGQQNEIIQEQQQLIRELQQREIERLQLELERLRRSKARPRGKQKKAGKR